MQTETERSNESPGDADLVTAILNGDADAEARLFLRYRRPAWIVVARVLGYRDDIEDVVHDAFLGVIQGIRAGRVRQPDSLSAFVLKAVKNTALNAIPDPPLLPLDPESCADHAWAPSGEQLLIEEEERIERMRLLQVVVRAISLLPADKRLRLAGRFIEGKRHAEIAREQGGTENSVKVDISRTLKKIRERLAGVPGLRQPR